MSADKTRTDETAALRRDAELQLEADAERAEVPDNDLQRLVHELQVHQIELEMQNAELVKVRAELEQYQSHLEELVEQRSKQLDEMKDRAALILQSAADGLYGTDAAGCINFINPAACDLLGYTQQQALGQNAHALFHHSKPDGAPYPEQECPSHQALDQGLTVRNYEEVFWHADGHAVPVMYAVHPITHNGAVSGAVTSIVDMSAQRAADRAREAALAAAENLARLRTEFVANMSHEIRTPLNGVLGFAEIGARDHQDPVKALHAFNQIRASGKHLLGVINDILDFSKIEAGRLTIEQLPVTLSEILDQIIPAQAERARARRLSLRVQLAPDMPHAFISDPLRLSQIFNNLLNNACKFTAQGEVALSATRRGDRLEFQVADTGMGMTEEQMASLFTPFQQADGSTTRRFGGSGLGLAITKQLLDLMQGDIRVASRPDEGSTFTFSIPYIPASVDSLDSIRPARRAQAAAALLGLTILVAEDNDINQLVMEELLSSEGAHVVLANNGLEAVERIRQDGATAYDIVLMDVEMPEMNGYEATRQIMALAPQLPVIGQTAHAMAEQRAQCLESGMVDHIAKPIDPAQLVAVILRHVALRH